LSTFFSWGPLDVLRPFALPSSFLVFLFYIVWCMIDPSSKLAGIVSVTGIVNRTKFETVPP